MASSSQSTQDSLPSLLAKQAQARRELILIRHNAATPRPHRYLVDSAMNLLRALDGNTIADAAAGLAILELALKSIQSHVQEEEIRYTFQDLLDDDDLSPDTIVAQLEQYSSIRMMPGEVGSIDGLYARLTEIKTDRTRPRPCRDVATSAAKLAQTLNENNTNDPGTVHKIFSVALKAIQNDARVEEIKGIFKDLLGRKANAAAINAELDVFYNTLTANDSSSQRSKGKSRAVELPPSSPHESLTSSNSNGATFFREFSKGRLRTVDPPPSPHGSLASSNSTSNGAAIVREFASGKRFIGENANETYKYGHSITLKVGRNNLPDVDFSITDRQNGGTYESHGQVQTSLGHVYVFE